MNTDLAPGLGFLISRKAKHNQGVVWDHALWLHDSARRGAAGAQVPQRLCIELEVTTRQLSWILLGTLSRLGLAAPNANTSRDSAGSAELPGFQGWAQVFLKHAQGPRFLPHSASAHTIVDLWTNVRLKLVPQAPIRNLSLPGGTPCKPCSPNPEGSTSLYTCTAGTVRATAQTAQRTAKILQTGKPLSSDCSWREWQRLQRMQARVPVEMFGRRLDQAIICATLHEASTESQDGLLQRRPKQARIPF